jgi:hypothetical protein
MAIRGQNFEVVAQILANRFGLSRRFDNDEILGHILMCDPVAAIQRPQKLKTADYAAVELHAC